MAKKLEAFIECPCNLDYGDDAITCEGVCDNGVTKHIFNSRAAFMNQIDNICSKRGGKKCPHYRAVSLLYERGLRN